MFAETDYTAVIGRANTTENMMSDGMVKMQSVVMGQHDVVLTSHNGDRWNVKYGHQPALRFSDVRMAIKQYEGCVRHQLECAEFLDK